MQLQFDTEKYPRWFLYFMILYFIILVWALSLSWPAYTFLESQLILMAMILPAILLAFYAFRLSAHLKAIRILLSILAIISIVLSIIMGYSFFF